MIGIKGIRESVEQKPLMRKIEKKSYGKQQISKEDIRDRKYQIAKKWKPQKTCLKGIEEIGGCRGKSIENMNRVGIDRKAQKNQIKNAQIQVRRI